MSNFDEKVKEVTERTGTVMQSFWSAMLTAHTVLLSVAVAIPALNQSSDQCQIKFVGLLATISIFGILFNFAALRMQYELIGRRLHNHDAVLSDKQRKRDISIAFWRNRLIRIFELAVAAFLVIEAFLLLLVLFGKNFPGLQFNASSEYFYARTQYAINYLCVPVRRHSNSGRANKI